MHQHKDSALGFVFSIRPRPVPTPSSRPWGRAPARPPGPQIRPPRAPGFVFCDSTNPSFFIRTRGAEPPLGSRIPRSGRPGPWLRFFNSTHPVLLHPDPWGRAPLGSRIPPIWPPWPWLRFFNSTHPVLLHPDPWGRAPLGSRIPRSGLPEPWLRFFELHPSRLPLPPIMKEPRMRLNQTQERR